MSRDCSLDLIGRGLPATASGLEPSGGRDDFGRREPTADQAVKKADRGLVLTICFSFVASAVFIEGYEPWFSADHCFCNAVFKSNVEGEDTNPLVVLFSTSRHRSLFAARGGDSWVFGWRWSRLASPGILESRPWIWRRGPYSARTDSPEIRPRREMEIHDWPLPGVQPDEGRPHARRVRSGAFRRVVSSAGARPRPQPRPPPRRATMLRG